MIGNSGKKERDKPETSRRRKERTWCGTNVRNHRGHLGDVSSICSRLRTGLSRRKEGHWEVKNATYTTFMI